MTFTQPEEAIKFIRETASIDIDRSFELTKYCAELLDNKTTEHYGRDIIIRILDSWEKIDSCSKAIWNDLVDASGLYPYLKTSDLSTSTMLRYEYHKSSYLPDVYLHSEQQKLSTELLNKNSVVVSAPTSFGKSLLIEEVIASKIYKNVVIIQPTLALLDETRKKLLKYKNDYKLIVSTSQEPDTTRGNIFLFTGERVVEYSLFQNIDFFVIDEFYKLSIDRDDDRAITLNYAFSKLLKQTNKFYLLGPMIKSIPASFSEKFKFIWYPTDFATVAVDTKNLEITTQVKAKEKKEIKKETLFKQLIDNKEQTLIYCSSPNKASQLAIEFLHYLKDKKIEFDNNIETSNAQMIEWINLYINNKWSIAEALKYGIAFHHGALPRHLGSSFVDAFNNSSIIWLFCTSTLIEGVNTSAKNVIFFDKEKGKKQIDFFDYKNIAGRSGRMKRHYIGNVIRFEKEPDQMELFVDIPIFNQANAPIEVLLTLDENQIDKSVQNRLESFKELPDDLQGLVKENYGISVDSQLSIINEIEKNLNNYHNKLNWNQFPNYDQLQLVIDIAWRHLLKPGENKADIRSSSQLTVYTIKYARLKSITALIQEAINDDYWISLIKDEDARINACVFFIMNVTRHWFDYKLPRWLTVISKLQSYVYHKNKMPSGNYSLYASMLENGFQESNIAALSEYDIPASAFAKISSYIPNNRPPESTITTINALSYAEKRKIGLIDYEINKFQNAI